MCECRLCQQIQDQNAGSVHGEMRRMRRPVTSALLRLRPFELTGKYVLGLISFKEVATIAAFLHVCHLLWWGFEGQH